MDGVEWRLELESWELVVLERAAVLVMADR
jgi:hypothetical protein